MTQRKKLKKLSKTAPLHRHDIQWLKSLGNTYEVPEDSHFTVEWFRKMLDRVDILPPSLVLVQSANESAWGTSRFAREGNNYFGIWCHSPGCGLVPQERPKGMSHEVRTFCSLDESLIAYFNNLNTNSAYEQLRSIRSRERNEGKLPDSLELLKGLDNYSERGKEYTSSLGKWIVRDNLRRFDQKESDGLKDKEE